MPFQVQCDSLCVVLRAWFLSDCLATANRERRPSSLSELLRPDAMQLLWMMLIGLAAAQERVQIFNRTLGWWCGVVVAWWVKGAQSWQH